MQFNRRDALKLGVVSAAALALPAERMARTKLSFANKLAVSSMPPPFTAPYVAPPVVNLTRDVTSVLTSDGKPFYRMVMSQFRQEIIPGLQTTVWGYDRSVPGPTVMCKRGVPVLMRHVNNLPSQHPQLGYRPWTSVHLHGSASLPQYDGYASDVASPGQYKDYQFPNTQDARTMWNNDHGVHRTASNFYMGLVAQYHIVDDLERSLPLPKGTDFEGKSYDQALTIQDATFGADGSLIYDDGDQSSLYGDVILVNGRPWPVMKVERRKYRFRILNASISRAYKLALSSGQPFIMIGTDGGLMPQRQFVRRYRHGMAERYEVVIDFSKYPIGERVVLQNLALRNNDGFEHTNKVMAFDVVSESSTSRNNGVPKLLNPGTKVMSLQESDASKQRSLTFRRSNGHWTINGRTWADVEASGFQDTVADPTLGEVEVWELSNPSGGWFHPVHIHLVDFRILSRNGLPPKPWELGPKDVVYVGEYETVRVAMRFGPYPGRYMVHCHNLVHEDHDMMHQFEIRRPDGSRGDDPIWADPPKDLPDPPP